MARKTSKILIAGDSFAANWPNCNGWVDMLATEYKITVVAQAGVGEYKILKQLESINTNEYDCVIVSHTSPSRIHVREHPLHKEGFHKDCDLLFNDIDRFSVPGSNLDVAKKWFINYYDDDYQLDIYKLLRNKINDIIHIPYISMSHIEVLKDMVIENTHLDFSGLWSTTRGTCNHYNDIGNRFIFNKLKIEIEKVL